MTARLFAFVIWAALTASVVAWALRLGAGTRPVPAHAVVVGDNASGGADLTRLLGAEAPVASAAAPQTPSSSRLKLLGVVAASSNFAMQTGLALIAIDGKPARPYRVGGMVEQDLVLLEVRQRSASLGPVRGPASVKLEMPPRVAAATGTRPMAINGSLPGPGGVPMRGLPGGMPPGMPAPNLLPPPPPPVEAQESIEEAVPMPEATGEAEAEASDNGMVEEAPPQPDAPPRTPTFGRRLAPSN